MLMMNTVLLIAIFFLSACTHLPKQKIQIVDANIREIKANSVSEANYILLNQQRYLHELFRQSRDPYYNKNKWSNECLSENVLGELHNFKGNPLLISVLYLDQSFQPGACFGELFHVIMIYCPDLGIVREIKINLADKLTAIDERSLCL